LVAAKDVLSDAQWENWWVEGTAKGTVPKKDSRSAASMDDR